MQINMFQALRKDLIRKRRRQAWKKAISVLACVVVFCTTYALILPAITMEEKYVCGKEEHIHNESCYTQTEQQSRVEPVCAEDRLDIHRHTSGCYDESGTLTCGYADFIVHEHTSLCYDAEGNLWCTLPEIAAHTHDESCYAQAEAVEEAAERILVCGREEIVLHEHDAACFDPDGNLICGQVQVLEHVHSDNCFQKVIEPAEPAVMICGLEEHIHDDSCKTAPETQEAEAQETEPQETEVQETEAQEAESQETESQEAENQEAEPQETESQEAESQESETQETEPQESGSQESEPQEPESQEADAPTPEELADPHAMADLIEPDPYGVMLLAEGEGTDFGQYINGVTLQYKNGNQWVNVGSDGVKEGDTLRFRIGYAIPGNTLTMDNKTITYQLPDTIRLENAQSGDVLNGDSKIVGKYKISQDGLIEITFEDDYIKENMDGSAINGFIAADTSVKNVETNDGKISINFTDTIKVEVPVRGPEQEKADLNVVKSAAVNGSDGTVSYTVTVTSKNGTNDKVTLTDVMENLELDGGVTVSGTGITDGNYTVTQTDNRFDIVLPEMKAGAAYIITYTAKAPASIETDMNARNTVHVESKDEDGSKIEDSKTVDTSIKQNYVSKSGTLSTDKQTVTWTVTVNAGKNDIGGWTLNDTLNGMGYTGPATMQGSGGSTQEITLPYTFPKGSNDTYTITYTTPADKAPGESQTKNRVDFTKDDGSKGPTSGEISVGDWDYYNPLTKKADSLTVNEDGTAAIRWSVTIKADKGDIPGPWTYQDSLSGGQYFTEEQIQAAETAIKNVLNEKGLTCGFERITEGDKITGFKLNIAETVKKGDSFTFTYSSTAPLPEGDKEQAYQNSGCINGKIWANGRIEYKPLVRKYDLNNQGSSETSHNYYDPMMDENGVLKWGFDITPPDGYAGGDLTVTEQLPEGVTLTSLTMKPRDLYNEVDMTIPGSYSFGGQYNMTTAIEGQTITVTVPAALVQREDLKELHFTVEARIDDDYSWPTQDGKLVASFENRVTVRSADGQTTGVSTQTQTVTKDNSLPVLTKSSGTVANNLVPYSITVNPDGKDLLPGADQLTLVDTAKVSGTTLSLIPDSVQVFKRNADGTEGERLDPGQVPYTLTVTEEGASWARYNKYVLELTLPDQTPLIVKYEYKVNSQEIGASKNIENSAKLKGEIPGAEESYNSISVSISDSAAGAVVNNITVVKVEAGNYGVKLSGAKFKLYGYNRETSQYEVVKDSEGNELTFASGNDGRFTLPELDYNTAYYLEETEAPEGYMLRDPYYFWIANDDETAYPSAIPEGFTGRKCTGSDSIYVSNEKSAGIIQVTKRWISSTGEDITGQTGGSVSFDLYRRESTEPPVGGASGGKVTLNWTGFKFGGEWFVEPDQEVAVGSRVTATMIAGENEYEKVEGDNIPKIKVNGAEFIMEREAGSSRFSYSFIITANTHIETSTSYYLFTDRGTHELKVEPPAPPNPADDTNLGTYTIQSDKGWKWSSDELPKSETRKKEDGSTETVYYSYYIVEAPVANCTADYDNNNGITSGTITVTNTRTDNPTHKLPSTGGPGIIPYTAGGLLLMTAAGGLLLYHDKKRRKEEFASS